MGLPLPGSPAHLWPRPQPDPPRNVVLCLPVPGPALGYPQQVWLSGGVCCRVLRTGQVQGEGQGQAPCMQRAGEEWGCRQGWPPWELSRGRPYSPPFTPGRKRAGRTSCRKPASRVGWRGALAGVRPGREFRAAPGARPSRCFSAGFLGLQCDLSGPLTLLMVPGAPR